MRRFLFLCVAAGLVAGCQDSPVDVPEPSFAISDGTHGGNPDFFFIPPMVANPPGGFLDPFDPNFFDIVVTICELVPVPESEITALTLCASPQPAGFPVVLDMTTPGLGGEIVEVGADHYHVDWHTGLVTLSSSAFYRISIFAGGIARVGFADVDVANTGRELKNVATGEFIALKDGRTLAIKFRLEPGLRCFDEATGLPKVNCAATVVNLADGGELTTEPDPTTGNVSGVSFPPSTAQVQTVSPTIVPCEDGNIPVDIPVFGDCFTIDVAGLTVDLVNPAVVFQCGVNAADLFAEFGLNDDQAHLLRWHRFDASTGGSDPDSVVALPLRDDPCAELTAMNLESNPVMRFESNPVMRFARAVRDRVGALVGPQPLFAARPVMFWDSRSGGGSVRFSDFQLALPSKMEIVEGQVQYAQAGTAVAIAPAVTVTDAHGGLVEGATVTFTDDDLGTVHPTTVVTDATGIAAVSSWIVDVYPGNFTHLTASCFGCAVEGNDGPQLGIFDPFTPLPGTPSPLGPLADEPDVAATEFDPNEPTLRLGELIFTAQGN